MGRRRCCCECARYLDTFARDDADELGFFWEHDAGWSIDGNAARVEDQDAGEAIFTRRMPDPQGSMIVYVDLVDPDYEDAYDVILRYDDEDNYLFARYVAPAETDDPQVWRQGIGSRIAGVESIDWDDEEITPGCGTMQEPFTHGVPRTVLVHYDRAMFEIGGFTFGITFYGFDRCFPAVAVEDVNRGGLRHGGGPRPVFFRNFRIEEHRVTNPDCDDFSCRCQFEECVPEDFTLSLVYREGKFCEELPETIDIHLSRLHKSDHVWRSERVIECLGSVQEPSYRQFFLVCSGSPRNIFFRLYCLSQIYDATPEQCVPSADPFQGVDAVEWESIEQECSPYLLHFRGGCFGECCFDPGEPPPDPPPPAVYDGYITAGAPE